MMDVNVFVLIMWIIVGILQLVQEEISKISYTFCWLCLIMYLCQRVYG